jgi:hypothetical protein
MHHRLQDPALVEARLVDQLLRIGHGASRTPTPFSCAIDFVDIRAFVLGQPGNCRPRRLLQFLQQFDHDDARHLRY